MPGVLVSRGLSLLSLGIARVKSLIVGTPIPGAKKAPRDAGALRCSEPSTKTTPRSTQATGQGSDKHGGNRPYTQKL